MKLISYFNLLLLAPICLSFLTACEQSRPFSGLWITPGPLHADVTPARPLQYLNQQNNSNTKPQLSNPTGVITLHDAITLALNHNPQLEAIGSSVVASQHDADQLAQPPNPKFGIGIENFSGPNAGNTFRRQTLRLSQVIELSDKRKKRTTLGQATQRLRAWDYEQKRINIAADTASFLVAVAVSQERLNLNEQQLKLAQKGFEIADDRVKNGTSPSLERDQAASRVAINRIALEQTRQILAADRADLASAWGAENATFIKVQADLNALIQIPPLDQFKQHLDQSPLIARWYDEILQRQSKLELERANATPDPTIGAGIRNFPDANDTAGIFELSWPLNVFDDNRHGILAARMRVAQAHLHKKNVKAQATATLSRAYARQQSAYFALQTLDTQAIPSSTSAYNAILNAYKAGLTDYLNVIEAERTLLEIQNQRLNAARNYHIAIIEIERITAWPVKR